MAIVKMVNGALTINNRPAKWCQWTLTVADLDGGETEAGDQLQVPGALGGLPGGHSVDSETALFDKFKVPVQGETVVQGPGGGKATLGVNFRARRANDFTGAGLRSKEVDAEAGEKNELQQADRLVRELVDAFTKDAAGAVGDREKKEQRAKLAAALRELAKAL